MLQTSYVPLEHPYKIIEYQGIMGIQIGTLIVTKDKSGRSENYAIETHSHPVVSYVNNRIHSDLKHPKTISLPRPYEGVVWDKVELHQVNTLIREDESMGWQDFMEFCRNLRIYSLDLHYHDVEQMIFDSYGQLLDWGIDIKPPHASRSGERILKVELDYTFNHNDIPYCYTSGDLGMIAGIVDNDVAIEHFIKQTEFYLNFMDHFGIHVSKVKFWTQNLFLQDLTEKLKMHEKKLQSYNRHCLLPFEDNDSL